MGILTHIQALKSSQIANQVSSYPVRAPDLWFAEAAEVGRQVELELLAIRLALQELSDLPTDIYVALNVSPDTILSGQLPAALEGMAPEQIVLEITEHTSVEDYAFLTRALQPLRQRGLRIAVDDAGAGYASLRHVLQLKPEMIKLDVTLTRNIDEDLARRALASALIAFAKETGSLIIAEGVEAASELAVLRRLGAHQAQGHVFSKPMSLAELLDLLEQELSVPREFPPQSAEVKFPNSAGQLAVAMGWSRGGRPRRRGSACSGGAMIAFERTCSGMSSACWRSR
ncbi:EAL domain-containing protein [Aurantimonas sp. A3-2-R12]|uniref:EAL domain-containing protein n=1 Tax=Aurantimonas sp. A3-2-R12 TaxID=3114362 RepID=UPI002E19E28F|nr:EAL domain-containing protein [Aurantimonas sp. A3-2-R12]